ncbi:hypothetical protein BJ138DRAFT_1105406 [Hygrophoropsis aurantiaca]|uniref:Uncharacterized protein n=1 Tax=Hygrophoropsis aurantiaca TaxID=72124 RepID=A0ACB7ZZK1_9AGAM|nr:hypothetical protein BJ138DRAFT_1105406 [Hygrophoropsis aurantiaca]
MVCIIICGEILSTNKTTDIRCWSALINEMTCSMTEKMFDGRLERMTTSRRRNSSDMSIGSRHRDKPVRICRMAKRAEDNCRRICNICHSPLFGICATAKCDTPELSGGIRYKIESRSCKQTALCKYNVRKPDRDPARASLFERFLRLTRLFFGDHYEEFPFELLRSKGAITGSAAQEMYLGRGAADPRDLNIVVPRGGFLDMEDWLLRIGYEEYEGEVELTEMRDVMEPFLQEFRTYRAHSKKVTVSEAKAADIMEVIVNSPTTAEMLVMTAGGLIVLYPELATSGITLLGPTGGRVYRDGGRFGSVNGAWGDLYTDNRHMDASCGARCPSIWRHTRNDRNILIFDWDKRYTVRGILQNSQTEWRLNMECLNPHCEWGVYKLEAGPSFWRPRVPATNLQIIDTELDIVEHVPRFEPGFKGLLYATLAYKPVIVNVPSAEGIHECRGLDDLKVDCWVRQRGTDATYAHRSKLRRTYKCFPGAPTLDIDNVYTMFVEEPGTKPQLNAQVNALALRNRTTDPILGNVLFIKQTNDANEAICDMVESDSGIIKILLRSALKNNILPANTPRGR